jgi:hypothetical protein
MEREDLGIWRRGDLERWRDGVLGVAALARAWRVLGSSCLVLGFKFQGRAAGPPAAAAVREIIVGRIFSYVVHALACQGGCFLLALSETR